MTHASLTALTQALVDIPSVSKDEAAVHSFIAERMKLPLAFQSDGVDFYCEPRTNKPLLVFAGHTDTVPIANNVPSELVDGVITGRGTTDMKGALAVMIELAEHLVDVDTDYDVGYLFFAREELPQNDSALRPALAASELLRSADFAVLMEPTNNALELGCQGNLNITVSFDGVAAHSARPWMGSNAIHTAITAFQSMVVESPNDVVINGLLFREVASITGVRGGVAKNVIPDHVEFDVNIRFAPNRTSEEAEKLWTEKFVALGASVETTACSPGAPVIGDDLIVDALLASGAKGRTAKQAWTNAADFAEYGVPCLNFGPGDPSVAHRDDEHITTDALELSAQILKTFFHI